MLHKTAKDLTISLALLLALVTTASAQCTNETECAANVNLASARIDSAPVHSNFDSARIFAAKSTLLATVADWDDYRCAEIDHFLAEIDSAIERAATGDGTLSVLLANRQRAELILSTASGRRTQPLGARGEELLAGIEELKAAGEQVNQEIGEIRQKAEARKQTMEKPELVREELLFRQFAHRRRSEVTRSLAGIYASRAARVGLAADRQVGIGSIERAADIELPRLPIPELDGAGNLDPKDQKRVLKQAARLLKQRERKR